MRTAAETFAASAASTGAARRMVTATLSAWQLEELRDDLRSVVSELASNAALHARSPFVVTLTQDEEVLRVAVTDRSSVRPRVRRRSEPDATTGRGLLLVEALSSEWGVQPEPDGGKTVWCHFCLPAASGNGLSAVPETRAGVEVGPDSEPPAAASPPGTGPTPAPGATARHAPRRPASRRPRRHQPTSSPGRCG